MQRLRRVAERARRRRRAVVVVLVQPHLLCAARTTRAGAGRARGEAVERLEREVDDALDGAPALVRAADAALEEQRGRIGRAVRRRELRLAQRVHRAERHHVAQGRAASAKSASGAPPRRNLRGAVRRRHERVLTQRDREGLGARGGGEREGGEGDEAHFIAAVQNNIRLGRRRARGL